MRGYFACQQKAPPLAFALGWLFLYMDLRWINLLFYDVGRKVCYNENNVNFVRQGHEEIKGVFRLGWFAK